MRIAFVSQAVDCVAPGHTNSVGLVTHHLATTLAKQDEVVVFASLGCPENAKVPADGPLTYRLIGSSRRDQLARRAWPYLARATSLARSGLRPPASTTALLSHAYGEAVAREIHLGRYDVIHVQHGTQYLPLLRRAAPDAVIVLHTHAEWFAQTSATTLAHRLRAADVVIAPSEHTVRRIAAYVPSIADKAVCVHNGVSLDRFAGRRRSPSFDHRPPLVVLYVGALSPHKGVHDLIAAFSAVAADFPDAQLRLAGPPGAYPIQECFPLDDRRLVSRVAPWWTGAYDERLVQLVPTALASRVHFLGSLQSVNAAGTMGLVEEYLAADVVVCPSICDESFGLPVLEAMAAGAPVLATRAGGQAELVVEGETGFLVDKADAGALATRLACLLEDPRLRGRLGSSGRRRAGLFDWPVVTDQLREVYGRALATKKPFKISQSAGARLAS